jgi:hypothetical protein
MYRYSYSILVSENKNGSQSFRVYGRGDTKKEAILECFNKSSYLIFRDKKSLRKEKKS